MARLRAVVVIHPPGFGGTPDAGHRSAAVAKASATASSARSTSPRTRISVAVQRPASRRKIAASSSFTLERADLDGALAGRGGLPSPLERGIEVGCLDDPEAAHLLLRLGVGAVRHRRLALVRADDRGGAGRLQAAAEHPQAALGDLLVERVDLA